MSKLNWAAKQEYEFMNNYKVLQETFKRNKITKPIPVERLMKCKMQDNLEWLQWSKVRGRKSLDWFTLCADVSNWLCVKKFWDTNFPGHEYDPEARRQGQAAVPPPLHGSVTVGAARGMSAAPRAPAAARPAAARPSAASGGAAPVRRPAATASSSTGLRARVPGARTGANASAGGVSTEALQALTAQMEEMKVSVDSLEKERDFYFGKLRDIELLVQERLGTGEEDPEAEQEGLATGVEAETLKQIQAVLYSTEEGFEVPEGGEVSCGARLTHEDATIDP